MKINYAPISPELTRSVPGGLDENSVSIYLPHEFLEVSKLGRVITGYPEHLVIFLCLFITTIRYYLQTYKSAFQIPTQDHISTPFDATQPNELQTAS
jgi:hypothetical protein